MIPDQSGFDFHVSTEPCLKKKFPQFSLSGSGIPSRTEKES